MKRTLTILCLLFHLSTFGQTELDSLIISNTLEDTSTLGCFPEMPEFPSGERGLQLFVENNLKIPESFKGKGRIVIQYTIEKTGALTNIIIVKSLSPDCDKEVIKLFGSMPDWIPGGYENRKIKIILTRPIYFKKGKASIYSTRWKGSH